MKGKNFLKEIKLFKGKENSCLMFFLDKYILLIFFVNYNNEIFKIQEETYGDSTLTDLLLDDGDRIITGFEVAFLFDLNKIIELSKCFIDKVIKGKVFGNKDMDKYCIVNEIKLLYLINKIKINL